MSWIDAIFHKIKNNTKWARMLNGYTPIFSQFGQDVYASDVVQQAIKCVADEMKKLNPCHVRMEGDDPIPVNGSIQRVLNNPNPLMGKSAFLEKVTWLLLLNFNAFIIPVYDAWYDENGRERRNYRALYPVKPSTVTFIEDASGTLYIKMDFENNFTTTLPYADVIHLRYKFSVSEFMGGNAYGKPDNDTLLKTLEINHDMLQGIGKAVKGSFAINGVVNYNSMLDGGKTETAIKEFEGHLRNSSSGILPLDIKASYSPVNRDIKLVDADTLKFIDEKILRNWGVSIPILTGDYTKEQYEAFYQKTLEPMIIDWSDEFGRVLFTERQKSFNNRIMLYPKKLVFMSMDQTLEMIRLLGDSGAMFENEKRTALGMMPITELTGKRKQSLNYVDVEIANSYQAGNTGGIEDGTEG